MGKKKAKCLSGREWTKGNGINDGAVSRYVFMPYAFGYLMLS